MLEFNIKIHTEEDFCFVYSCPSLSIFLKTPLDRKCKYYTLPLTFPLFLLHSGAGKAGSEKGAGAGTAGGGPGPSGQKAETVILSKNALDNGEVLHFFLEFLQLASL